MKTINYILSAALIATIANASEPFLNQENKSLLKTLAKNYAGYGLTMGITGAICSAEITKNGYTSHLFPRLATAGKFVANAGGLIFSPVASAIGTALLPITVPASYMGTRWAINHPKASSLLQNENAFGSFGAEIFKAAVPGMVARKVLVKTPAAAIVGFGGPLAFQKWQQSQEA